MAANNRPQIKEEANIMFYEVELVDMVPGYVIEAIETEKVIIPADWDI